MSILEALRDFTKVCSHCPDEVVWVSEKVGRKETRIPIHAEPQADGNLTVTVVGRRLVLGRPSALAAKAMSEQGVPLYRRHALLCPQAHRWSSNSTGYGFAERQPLGTTPIRRANPGRVIRKEKTSKRVERPHGPTQG